MTIAPVPTPLTDAEFQAKAGVVLSLVESAVDRWLDDDVVDIDAKRTGGMLELSLPQGGVLVINTQPPLHELWLATRAGGYHFKYCSGQWLERAGREFYEVLAGALSEQCGKDLKLAPRG